MQITNGLKHANSICLIDRISSINEKKSPIFICFALGPEFGDGMNAALDAGFKAREQSWLMLHCSLASLPHARRMSLAQRRRQVSPIPSGWKPGHLSSATRRPAMSVW
jgi:hypothetical protein